MACKFNSYFCTLHPILLLEIFGNLSQVKFISTVRQFCEKNQLILGNTVKTPAKSGYFFPSRLFTFHSLVQLLLPTVKLNGVSQPISIEYKMVHGLNQAMFRN